jgi:uncharacterized protein YkwD
MNPRVRLTGLLAALWLFLSGGCPLYPTGQPYTPGVGGAGTRGSSAGGSAGGSSGGSATGTQGITADGSGDELTRTFPDCYPAPNAEAWEAEVLQLVNRERTARGLAVLTRDATLQAQAEQYACEMIQYDFFAHEDPVTQTTLRDRAEEFGYVFQVIGENLAAGQPSPAEVMRDWMDSEGHRENILDERFTEIGIAVRAGGDYYYYWVQEFGRPR